ncbi:class I SAM-dependent methyltransferase [Streptomyces sp. NPDC050418]|uniref:class I SAM-dependent methyltransferase n=1 Tax=Streptomyces sp. NPDC050418 TaxID=3365612 RepID=UPI0037AC711F
MLDYTAEAAEYDRTRGGAPRADAAAAAVRSLLPPGTSRLLDVACGTGIVTERLGAPGRRVVGVDPAPGMAALASARVPGSVLLADGTRLPFASSTFDAVTAIWLLHLLPDAEPVIAECARVLRPGGVLVVTVDKDAGHDVGSDVDTLLAPYATGRAADAASHVLRVARAHGLSPVGEATFQGHGQGRSPRTVASKLRNGWYRTRVQVDSGALEGLASRVESLPRPGEPRGEPCFRLLALKRLQPPPRPFPKPGAPPPDPRIAP